MKINRLTIENFKLFENRSFDFHPQFNLIVGINGSGKTTLLRAATVALGGWAHAYIQDPQNRRPIQDTEIREVQKDKRFDKTSLISIKAEGTAIIIDRNQQKKEGSIKWERTRKSIANDTITSMQMAYKNVSSHYSKYYPIRFTSLGSDTLSYIEHVNTFDLPLIAVYECDRLWISTELSVEESVTTKYSRFDAYKDCFHTSADHKAIGQWLLKYQLAEAQNQNGNETLECIKIATCAALEGATSLRFDFEESRVVVEFENERSIPFEHLSDGQRTTVGLFCDIARRASLLNPHLGKDACSKTPGVVLIDELDLHLHPSWQRRIVKYLRNTFPLIQFICTTHSPQLIGQVSPAEIIRLDKDQVSHPTQSLGMDSNWILQHVMNSDDRDPIIATEIDKLYQLIEEANFDLARELHLSLHQTIGEHPDLIEANALIERYTRFKD